MTKEELEKENAELKELKKKKEEIEIMTNFCKACKKMHTDNLTKAKELLKKVLDLKKVVTKAEEYLLLEEAEQFLKETK